VATFAAWIASGAFADPSASLRARTVSAASARAWLAYSKAVQ